MNSPLESENSNEIMKIRENKNLEEEQVQHLHTPKIQL